MLMRRAASAIRSIEDKMSRCKRYNVIKNMQRREFLTRLTAPRLTLFFFSFLWESATHQRRKFSDVVIRNAKEKEGENASEHARAGRSSLASDAKKLRSPSFLKRGHEHTANLPAKKRELFRRASAPAPSSIEREREDRGRWREPLFIPCKMYNVAYQTAAW